MRKSPVFLWSRGVAIALLGAIVLSFGSGCIVRPWGHRHHHHHHHRW